MDQTKTNKRKSRKIDPKKVKSLATIGLPPSDIAKHQDVHPSTITRFLQKNDIKSNTLAFYQQNKAALLALYQYNAFELEQRFIEIYTDMPKEQLKALPWAEKTGVMNHCTNFGGMTFDKERSIINLNIGNINIIPLYQRIDRRLEELAAELRGSVDKSESEDVDNPQNELSP